jgi:hypothetical protein
MSTTTGIELAAVYLSGGLTNPYRAIDTIISDVVITESAVDKVSLTKHPVEYGAQISDHAIIEQPQLTINVGFSDSGSYIGYVQDAYAEFLSLKDALAPVMVYTGKRVFYNMFVTGLSTTTDKETENVLHLTVTMEGLLLVQLTAATVSPAAQQANPQDTASPTNSGQQQLQAPTTQDQSFLSKVTGSSQ